MRQILIDILKHVPLLTPVEMAEVRAAMAAAEAFGGGPLDEAAPITSDVDWVLDAIATKMQELGLDMSKPSLLRRGAHFSAFKDKVPALMAYLKRVGDSKTRQRALLYVGVDLLQEDVANIGLAVTSRTIMLHLHRLPSVINRQFPGYAQSNYLRFVIQSQTKEK